MITVIFTHKVKNFSDWKKVFDRNSELRQKAGVNITGLYQSIDDENMVTMIGEAPDIEAVKNLNSNPEMLSAMEKGGDTGIPEFKFLNKVSL